MKEYSFNIYKAEKIFGAIKVVASRDGSIANIVIVDGANSGLKFSGRDYFRAMSSLRDHLEEQGIKLGSLGAHLHVYPSGMSSDMTFGAHAYKLCEGEQATRDKIVSIFATITEEDVKLLSFSSEQKNFRRKLFAA
jgi:hypothetical protein